jgi:hypothetical protein
MKRLKNDVTNMLKEKRTYSTRTHTIYSQQSKCFETGITPDRSEGTLAAAKP